MRRAILKYSPSLKSYLDQALPDAYELALALAIQETKLGEQIFPKQCPYTLEEALDPEFLLS